MKFTLLEITQDILNDMSGDEVSSIEDTSESLQIANIVRSTYWHLVSQKNLPEHKGMFNLVESASSSDPVHMTVPSHALSLDWVKYNWDTDADNSLWELCEYREWPEFLYFQDQLNEAETSVTSISVTTANSDTWELKYQNDRMPQYWSTPDDYNIYFSSIDLSVDTDLYLYTEKTQCYGLIKPTFTLTDGFTPDLDATEFNWLIEEAKSACSVKLRQVDDPIASKRARRGWVRSQRQSENVPAGKTNYTYNFPNFGRRK